MANQQKPAINRAMSGESYHLRPRSRDHVFKADRGDGSVGIPVIRESKTLQTSISKSAGRVDDDLESTASDDGLIIDEEEFSPGLDGPTWSHEGPNWPASPTTTGNEIVTYRTFKRRWFGVAQLVLLNIIVSWNWLTFTAISSTSASYFKCTEHDINWLSTAFLFAFVIAAPVVIYMLQRGPKPAILVASILLLIGNWVRYIGTTRKNYGIVMFGQIFTGLAQPFVLAAPTRYSELWFTGAGRVASTAVMSLANPLGGAIGQLVDSTWENQPDQIPFMVLIISVISTIATIPSVFIAARPPIPCCASSQDTKQNTVSAIRVLLKSPEFIIIFVPFSVLVGCFNSVSGLINQILEPYGFSEIEAGIAGGLLIIVGLLAAAITSPLVDKYKKYLLAMKVQVPLVSLCYLVFIWMPPTRSLVSVCIVLGLLGAASFSLVPIVLEYLCEITYPISPEITSTICWSGGQLLGAIFIVTSGYLVSSSEAEAPSNMQRYLWFQAAVALAIVPLVAALGSFGRERHVRLKRYEADAAGRDRVAGPVVEVYEDLEE